MQAAAPAPVGPVQGQADKASRIVEAMRESVAEVGIVDSTFDRVAGRAGVSRGLLHYYFGSKERLLIEVIRKDTRLRIETLGAALRAADSVDEVIAAFAQTFQRTLETTPGYVYMVSELFVAGRHNPEILRELGQLYATARDEFAAILRAKEKAGVVRLRYPAEDVLTYLFAAGDGASVQMLSEPERDFAGTSRVSDEVARLMLWREG
jgi:AcrR family transcriptional regulator